MISSKYFPKCILMFIFSSWWSVLSIFKNSSFLEVMQSKTVWPLVLGTEILTPSHEVYDLRYSQYLAESISSWGKKEIKVSTSRCYRTWMRILINHSTVFWHIVDTENLFLLYFLFFLLAFTHVLWMKCSIAPLSAALYVI